MQSENFFESKFKTSFLSNESSVLFPSLNSDNGRTSNNARKASSVCAPSLRCTCFISDWKSSLITSPSNTKSLNSFLLSASSICGKLLKILPFLLYKVVELFLVIPITLTPSYLYSTKQGPLIFLGCLAPSWASMQENTGTLKFISILLATLLTVF